MGLPLLHLCCCEVAKSPKLPASVIRIVAHFELISGVFTGTNGKVDPNFGGTVIPFNFANEFVPIRLEVFNN